MITISNFKYRVLSFIVASLFILAIVAIQASPTYGQWATSGNNINNTNTGNVGIGTTSPANPLTIARSGSAPWTTRPAYELVQLIDRTDNKPQMLFGSGYNGMILRYTGTDATAANQRLSILNGALAEIFAINNSGNLGIGTTSPVFDGNGAKYVAVDSGSTALSTLGVGSNQSGTTSSLGYLSFFNSGLGTTEKKNALIAGANDGATNSGNLQFHTANAGTFGERMRIDKNGNVGIGTSTPGNKLHVAGSITVDGNINAKYQDLAEWVESSQALSPGTVVVVDQTKTNQVVASSQGYDTRVAGVISAQPGITLGEAGEKKVLVATTGRVRVKVDASRGAIKVGDLLVTSDVAGVAMKSQPVNIGGIELHRPGTLIGKALEPLEKGQGSVLVLLSLQ